MSIAAKQHNCEEGTPQHQQTQVKSQPNTPNAQQKQQQSCLQRNSTVIDNRIRENQQQMTKKKVKQLTKQTPVASIEEEQRIGVNTLETETVLSTKAAAEDYTEIYGTPPDYRIYQNGKVNEFFKDVPAKNENNPKTISDVCLVNDHYILVKMPSTPEPNQMDDLNGRTAHIESQRTNRKLCHYLRNKRGCIRKIAPINEEPEEYEHSDKEDNSGSKSKSSHCLNVNSCWQVAAPHEDDVEVYQTRTKIHTTTASLSTPANSVINNKKTKPEILCQPLAKLDHNNEPTNHRPQEVQSISSAVFMSSLQDTVNLSNKASLVDNDNTDVDIGFCQKPCTTARRRKCPRFESFHWLLRPFHGKYRKPKPKIQAVVYKTYFVKWTKPPETLNHGYGGVKSTRLADIGTSVIRRCRSAIF